MATCDYCGGEYDEENDSEHPVRCFQQRRRNRKKFTTYKCTECGGITDSPGICDFCEIKQERLLFEKLNSLVLQQIKRVDLVKEEICDQKTLTVVLKSESLEGGICFGLVIHWLELCYGIGFMNSHYALYKKVWIASDKVKKYQHLRDTTIGGSHFHVPIINTLQKIFKNSGPNLCTALMDDYISINTSRDSGMVMEFVEMAVTKYFLLNSNKWKNGRFVVSLDSSGARHCIGLDFVWSDDGIYASVLDPNSHFVQCFISLNKNAFAKDQPSQQIALKAVLNRVLDKTFALYTLSGDLNVYTWIGAVSLF